MSKQKYVIELDAGAEGSAPRGFVEPDDADWLAQRLGRSGGPARVRILSDDSGDTEGHALRTGTGVRAILVEGDDDTEGHAISIHFPSASEADAFRKRLLLTGVLVGTVALGAAGGIGLANLSSEDAATAGAAQSAVTGSDWTQVERPAAAAASVAGSDWTQAERPGEASGAASGAITGSDWTQAERPGAASTTSSDEDDAIPPGIGGPTPR